MHICWSEGEDLLTTQPVTCKLNFNFDFKKKPIKLQFIMCLKWAFNLRSNINKKSQLSQLYKLNQFICGKKQKQTV